MTPAKEDPSQQPPPKDEVKVSSKDTGLLSRPENMTPVWVGLGVGAVGGIGAILFYLFKNDAQSKADTVANTIRSDTPIPARVSGFT